MNQGRNNLRNTRSLVLCYVSFSLISTNRHTPRVPSLGEHLEEEEEILRLFSLDIDK
jgi:hypothetical protein